MLGIQNEEDRPRLQDRGKTRKGKMTSYVGHFGKTAVSTGCWPRLQEGWAEGRADREEF